MLRLSTILRRTHLYLALFLSPWMLMYAASTVAMNHRTFFVGPNAGPVPFERERELTYDVALADGSDLRAIARTILSSQDLDGAHSVTRRADGAVVIARQDLTTPRRLTYVPAEHRLTIERQPLRVVPLLERLHRRRGYATGYTLDSMWAVSVDVVIVAMMFWALSGLWMWWEMKVTRRLGASALAAGISLFAFYLLML